jgi:hypothetical protein
MMLTVEEYMFLRSQMDGAKSPSAAEDVKVPGNSIRRRRKSSYSKAMSKELRSLNTRFRTKKGDYRKGYNAARIMKIAHKNVRRAMK